jgi:hypothetical protein
MLKDMQANNNFGLEGMQQDDDLDSAVASASKTNAQRAARYSNAKVNSRCTFGCTPATSPTSPNPAPKKTTCRRPSRWIPVARPDKYVQWDPVESNNESISSTSRAALGG